MTDQQDEFDELIEELEAVNEGYEHGELVREVPQHPALVIVTAVLMFVSAVWLIPLTFFAETNLPVLALGAAVTLAISLGVGAAIAVWMRQRWGVVLYAVTAAVMQAVLAFSGNWNIFVLLVPAVIIGLGVAAASHMD